MSNVQTRLIKLHWRRRVRKGQRQVEGISAQAEANIERHLFKRFERLWPVKRFVIGWIGLLIILITGVIIQNFLLSNYYQEEKTIPGGIYSEGIQGQFTNANPIYASSNADTTISRLLFAGLLKTDENGNLVGDLAKDFSYDSKGTTLTVHLKPNLHWQDNQPLTSKDVLFTFQMIQNPDAQSPLFSSWQGVSVTAPDNSTVIIKLPDVLASFPYNLTTGIIPWHLLAKTAPGILRSSDFNTTHPVGAGPFTWQAITVINGNDPIKEQVQIGLKPFTGYNGGAPKLKEYDEQIYANQDVLIKNFKNKQLSAMAAINASSEKVQTTPGVIVHSLILRAEKMVFFKTTNNVLSDVNVRQALVMGSNIPAIVANLGYSTKIVNEPLLIGQLAYDKTYIQARFNLISANQKLDAAGWLKNKNGIRSKNNQLLSFKLTSANNSEDIKVVKQLSQNWAKIGVKLNPVYLSTADYKSALTYHDYDSILSAISIGVDPDVFVYWDSSQADVRSTSRLNLSEYNNPTVDTALESGRTRIMPDLRIIKYKPFLSSWQQDAPALGLYQPRLLYLTNGPVGGLDDKPLSNPVDRFRNVQNWEIIQAKVTD